MKKFLSKDAVLAATIAVLSSGAAYAGLPDSVGLNNHLENLNSAISTSTPSLSTDFVLFPSLNDVSDQLNKHAAHASHASHGSHGSHASHSSHYSSS